RLPAAAPQARGKALINILPLEQGENITTIMPLPEDEKTWAQLDVMFATTRGTVRRNKLSDFVDVRRSGIIAMKLDEGDAIVDVQICTENDDVLLTASGGQCIRFPVTDVRVFQGRSSDGGRGEQRYVEMSAAEQFVLTVSEHGYGKRSSSYEYRITGRGGKGIVAMDVRERDGTIRKKTGKLIASFPVEDGDQLMLVTDGGQLIRTRVEGIRIAGRSTQGVIVVDTAEGARVVSVERISEEGEEHAS